MPGQPVARPVLLAAVALLLPAVCSAERLLELYDQAIATNPVLRGRDFSVEQARAQKDLARSRLLPKFSAEGSYDWNNFDQEDLPENERYTGRRGVLVASQPLIDVPAYHRLRGAQVSVQQTEFERNAVEMEIAADVVDRYLTLLQAEDDIVYLQAEKDAIENQLKRLRFMLGRRMAKVADLYEVEAYYQALLTREIEARNARAVARERLRETTGVAVDDVARLTHDTFPAVPGNEEQWTRDAFASNPSLLALDKAREAASRLVSSTRAEYLPRLSVAASQIYSDQGYDNREVPSYDVGTVGLQLSVPIYEGGRVQASVRDAVAQYNIAGEQYEAARREVETKARSAYLTAVAGHARTRSATEETRAMEKVVEAQEKSYEYRVTTVLDVLIARRRLIKARSDESAARYDYIRALAGLQAQVGGLNRSVIEQIDGWMVTAEAAAAPAAPASSRP